MIFNKTNTWVDRAFVISMLAKGFNGLLELIGGALLLMTSSQSIQQFVSRITAEELSEDPTDFLAHFALSLGHQIGSARLFGALYLLLHGIVKLVLVYYLLQRKLLAYPWALTVLSFLALYQGYLLWHRWSVSLLFLTLVDLVIIWLVWLEYKRLVKLVL